MKKIYNCIIFILSTLFLICGCGKSPYVPKTSIEISPAQYHNSSMTTEEAINILSEFYTCGKRFKINSVSNTGFTYGGHFEDRKNRRWTGTVLHNGRMADRYEYDVERVWVPPHGEVSFQAITRITLDDGDCTVIHAPTGVSDKEKGRLVGIRGNNPKLWAAIFTLCPNSVDTSSAAPQ